MPDSPIKMLSPKLPSADALLPWLRKIDASRNYTNYGLLWLEFRNGLSEYLKGLTLAPEVFVTFTTSGTTAIEIALRSVTSRRSGLCIMPSYTFIASAHAVVNAGLTPFLVDVDPTTLCITPSIVEKALVGLGEEPAAVLVVSAFGSPPEIEMWEDFEQRTGIPVVFDAAAALTSLKKIGHQPICVSLHATKVFGIGEGGAIISNDFNRNELLTAMTGFGFVNQKRESAVLGGNYRISEYSAAIGLAVLSTIDEKLDRIRKIVMSYRSYLNNTSLRFQEGVGYDWVAMTLNVIVEADAVTAVTERLDSENIPWRYWWGMGTDRHPAFSTVSAADLSNTRSVAPRVIGVPFYEDMTVENVSRVVKCLT